MKTAFDISPPPSSTRVEIGGEHRFSFSVHSQLERRAEVRLQLQPEGDTNLESLGLSIEGNLQRPLDADETITVVAIARVPAGTASGNKSFRLSVFSIDSPEEEFATSSPVELQLGEAPAPDPQPPNLLWLWLLLGGLGFVAVIGLVLFLVLSGDPGYADKCEGECDEGLVCVPEGEKRICRRLDEEACQAAEECAGGLCAEGNVCRTRVAWDELLPGWKLDCKPELSSEDLDKGVEVSCSLDVGERGQLALTGTPKRDAIMLTGPASLRLSGVSFVQAGTAELTPDGAKLAGAAKIMQPLRAAGSEAAPQPKGTVVAKPKTQTSMFALAEMRPQMLTAMVAAVAANSSANLKQRIKTVEAQLANARNQARDVRNRNSARINTLNGEIGTLQAQIKQLSASPFGNLIKPQLEKELAKRRSELSSLQSQIRAADANVTRLSQQLSQLQADLREAIAREQAAAKLSDAERRAREEAAAREVAEAAAKKAQADLELLKKLEDPVELSGVLQQDGSYELNAKKALKTPYYEGELELFATPDGVSAQFTGRLCQVPYALDGASKDTLCPRVSSMPLEPDGTICTPFPGGAPAGQRCMSSVRVLKVEGLASGQGGT